MQEVVFTDEMAEKDREYQQKRRKYEASKKTYYDNKGTKKKATDKRRAKNKVAKASRKANR